jgi:hypothetical protein
MANHIGKLLASHGGDQAVAEIADRLQKYLDPRINC